MTKTEIQKILPGLGLSVGVAILAKSLALLFPTLGGATIAILLGIVLGNTVFKQPILQAGTKFSESRLLEYSVVLLGFTVTFQTIAQLGVRGFIFVFVMMTVVIISTLYLGGAFKFNRKMSMMMAGGNAVCGSSAIGAIAPAIKADDQEKGQIITLVNLLGTIMMLTLPFLGTSFFPKDVLAQGALIGGTLQSVGQVVAGASLIDPSVVQYAMLFKILRIILLVVVVAIFEKMAQATATSHATEAKIKKRTKKFPIPWYVTGFLIVCILNSFITLPSSFEVVAHFLSTWFETTALAAIGLRLDLRRFIKEGPRFLFYGLSVGGVQTVTALLFLVVFPV
ncbi:YeiH family protein [Enterococcus sp. AZ102]|uniref:YeiH family protein n=1 Tax=Enterococcus sp. AZ102 TaxID=2774865 RepID=UPI003F27B393